MKNFLKLIKQFYAEMGIVVGSLCVLAITLSFPFWLPIALLSYFNDVSKIWFGGKDNE